MTAQPSPPPALERTVPLPPGRCPSPRPRIILSGSPRGPARGRSRVPAAGTHSPRPGSGAARRRLRGAWAAEGSRAGWVCVAARGPGAPGRDASSLGPAPTLSSAVPAPAARGRRSQCPPAAASSASAAASLQHSALRPHPRPHLSCGCSNESGDDGGQTRASSPPSAWLPPPNYSHTPPPRAGSLQARGRRARASPASGRRKGGGEAGRQGGRHPSSQPPSARRPTAPSACWIRTRHAPCVRAPHAPACRLRDSSGRRGRWCSPASRFLGYP